MRGISEKKIIVTVQDSERNYTYDLEITLDSDSSKLHDDIIQTLNGCNASLFLSPLRTRLLCKRNNRFLDSVQNAHEWGVRNGDYITVIMEGIRNGAGDI